jgi:hypothetical protein
MFQHLNQREKVLAAVVGCLVPVVLTFFGLMHVYNQYKQGTNTIQSLEDRIENETRKKIDAMLAGTRRAYYYKPRSLPANPRYITEYQDWIERLIRECGMGYQTINKPRETNLAYKGSEKGVSVVARQLQFNFDAKGTLDEILKFCYEFERLELLHKIRQLVLTPVIEKNVLTGQFTAVFTVDVLALVEAEGERDFLQDVVDLPTSLEHYEQVVLTRNIFGTANNPPRLSLSRKSFETGEEISVFLSARDDDKNDRLTYEVVDWGEIKDGKLNTEEGSDRTTLVAPSHEIGEYVVKVRVSDSGFPPKSDEDELKITVKAKREKVVAAPAEPFRHATETQINRISAINGIAEVKIKVRTTGQVFELRLGDEFELDEEKWIVRDIGTRTLSLEVAGKLMEYKIGDFLAQPRKETLVKAADAEVSVEKS